MASSFRDMFSFYQHASESIENTHGDAHLNKEHIQNNTIYLDSAATTHRLTNALQAMQSYYEYYNANVHRGAYPLAQKATSEYENARTILAGFVNAKRSEEVVFTSGATSALNIVANGLSVSQLDGNKIVVCISEHHANLLPWQNIAKRFNLRLQAVYLDERGRFGNKEQGEALNAIDDDTAILAFAHVSNVLGNIYPINVLCAKARAAKAISVIDGTQAAAHLCIDVQDIGCDFYALSGHKMYAGTGIGILYGKYTRLEKLNASILGGEMIKHVSLDSHTLQAPPLKFEAGTPNIAGAIGMATAATFCMQYFEEIRAHERGLYDQLYNGLNVIEEVQIWGNIGASISLISFSVEGVHAYDLSTALANQGIAVRAGQHCAMPLLHSLNIEASLRVSVACYNTIEEVDSFLAALTHAIRQLKGPDVSTQSPRTFAISANLPAKPPNSANEAALNHEALLASVATIENQLINAQGWNEKHRLLLLNSKQIPMLALEDRNNENALSGCEAQVWIAEQDILRAYSDSKVVRGLLSVLINKANSLFPKSSDLASSEGPDAVKQDFDYHQYLQDLGLSHYFSQGRKDGIATVIDRLTELV
jgi:cysteine desulfurase/selenocysteine lyase